MSTIIERIKELRQKMAERDIDLYIVPTSDFHESEYVGEHFMVRKYITGFTGSAGTAVITKEIAGLWTDGRYFVQAEKELKGTGVVLFKMGEPGVPKLMDFVKENLPKGGKLGFDGRVMSAVSAKTLERIAAGKKAELMVSEDLIDLIWTDRPAMSAAPVMILPIEYSGKETGEKLSDIREFMRKRGADGHLVASLYDISWILNVRGGDINNVPVVLSYLYISQEKCIWFLNEKLVTQELACYLKENKIETRPYDAVYSFVADLEGERNGRRNILMIDERSVNYRILSSIPERMRILAINNPSELMKSKKNPTEVKNTKEAHIKDAVAMCQFMYWLKKNSGKIDMDEVSVSDYLEGLRRKQPGFLDLSFSTICAYGENAAMCHYHAHRGNCAKIKPEGFLLVDSGGHYMEGTTDITRTFAMGPLTQEMKQFFTRVCRANLNLANAKFRYGCTGLNLDYLAREPFWEINMDFNHGTGHGVGHILNVHEGPQGFRWQNVGKSEAGVLDEGMITTDEPGIYLEGKFGIRTENELLCRRGEYNEYGQFMYFEPLTFVPIDLDAILPEEMSAKERKLLNDYHKQVYEKMLPFMNKEEAIWLKEATREI